jgi:hypothetical protein
MLPTKTDLLAWLERDMSAAAETALQRTTVR